MSFVDSFFISKTMISPPYEQRLVASTWYNNLIVISIILAGVLVGIQTYPSMESNYGVIFLNSLVQIIFTIDCCAKIFREGVNPMNYWYVNGFRNFDYFNQTIERL